MDEENRSFRGKGGERQGRELWRKETKIRKKGGRGKSKGKKEQGREIEVTK